MPPTNKRTPKVRKRPRSRAKNSSNSSKFRSHSWWLNHFRLFIGRLQSKARSICPAKTRWGEVTKVILDVNRYFLWKKALT